MQQATWLDLERRADPCQLPPHDIPRRFLPFTIPQIEQPAIQALVKDYLTKFWDVAPLGIAPLMLGRSGQWKSIGAAVVAKQLYYNAKLPVRFVQCASVLPALERRRYDSATTDYLKEIAEVPFLVMDDFTTVRQGSWIADFLMEIAEQRYGTMKPTLWTGNALITPQNHEELSKPFGVAFTRRLLEGSEGFKAVVR